MATSFRIDASELYKQIKKLEGAGDKIIPYLYEAAVVGMDTFKQTVISFTPVNLGNLKRSYQYNIRTTAHSVRAELFSPLIYAEAMEYGRAKGKAPPVQPIAFWVLRKGIANRDDNVIGIAFAIARAIGEGTSRHQVEDGYKMFQKGFDAAKPKVDKYIDALPGKIARDIL